MLQGYSLASIMIFLGVVFSALYLDLHLHRKNPVVSIKNAALWSAIWISLSFGFAAYVGSRHGPDKALLFISGYLLEQSLSIDNLFVFMAIFSSFAIRDEYQHRILYFGILGALLFRFLFIAAGTSLLLLGKWVPAIFGAFVLWSAWQMLKQAETGDAELEDYANHWSVRLARNFFRVYPRCHGHNFFHREGNSFCMTPLMLCLITVETADIMFAFDSVPAVIAITQDPFLIYTSNIFAILGLRSMYFLLAAARRYLCHLEKAVIAILAFIGAKMLLDVFNIYHVSPLASLGVVTASLALGIFSSVAFPARNLEAVEDERQVSGGIEQVYRKR